MGVREREVCVREEGQGGEKVCVRACERVKPVRGREGEREM